MKNIVAALFLALAALAGQVAAAQETAWIQIEAQPSLREGEIRARAYSGAFPDVGGFAMPSGWYAIVLGPYTPAEAEFRLRDLRRENLIPRDSFVSDGGGFGQQFWPVGTDLRAAESGAAEPERNAEAARAEPLLPDETPAEARRGERALTREERELVQTALQWEGFYTSAIDGAFGRGTRAAMAAYQQSLGLEPTGVLTTRQRARLIEDYNAILDGVGMRVFVSEEAGIEMPIPAGMVEFSRFEPPFVHFVPTTEDGVRVLYISQAGTAATLAGLYEIMQTLEIVPLEGDRRHRSTSFTLTGRNDEISSYTHAALEGGLIKGFTLVWPAGDQRRMDRVLNEMRAGFRRFGDHALDETLGEPSEDQRVDLLAGLEIRQPDLSRTGFFVNARGAVVTAAETVRACERITLDRDHEAEVVFADEALGIAVLRPESALAPIAHARFREGVARLQSDIAVAGFPYGGVLNAPTLTFGQLADIRGLRGEEELQRLALAANPGDSGGPVFDMGGSVIGLLLPAPETPGQELPAEVSFSANSQAIRAALEENGVELDFAEPEGQMAPEDLTSLAGDMTVLVSCWN